MHVCNKFSKNSTIFFVIVNFHLIFAFTCSLKKIKLWCSWFKYKRFLMRLGLTYYICIASSVLSHQSSKIPYTIVSHAVLPLCPPPNLYTNGYSIRENTCIIFHVLCNEGNDKYWKNSGVGRIFLISANTAPYIS